MRRLGWRCLDWWGKGQKTSKILPIVADGSCEFLCQPISGYFWGNGIIVTRWPFNISWFGSNMGTKNWPTKSSMHKIHIIIWSQDVLSFFLSFFSALFPSFLGIICVILIWSNLCFLILITICDNLCLIPMPYALSNHHLEDVPRNPSLSCWIRRTPEDIRSCRYHLGPNRQPSKNFGKHNKKQQ